MERNGVCLPPNMARNNRNRSEFANGAGAAEDHAVKEAPANIGQSDFSENLPAPCAQCQGGLLLITSLRLHQRNQFTRNKGKGDKEGGNNNARG